MVTIIILALILLLPLYLFFWCLVVLAGRQRPFNGQPRPTDEPPIDRSEYEPIDLSKYVTRKGSTDGHRPDPPQG